MATYIDTHKPRVKLGRILYQNYIEQDRHKEIDFENLASEIGLNPQQLEIEIRTLKIAGFVDHATNSLKFDKKGKRIDGGPFLWEKYKKVFLTDDGILWADANFPPIPVPGITSISVSVDVQVAIEQTINIIQDADNTTEEQRQLVELLLRRLESELKKPAGKGRFSAVKELLESAVATKSLLGPVVKFLSDHANEIDGLSELL